MRLKFSALMLLFTASLLAMAHAQNQLAGDTVLIIRHAEKPASGNGLTALGEERAKPYVRYFEPFQEAGLSLKVDALYSGADSASSLRPRLTLEPLSKATGMPLHATVDTKNPEELVEALKTQPHGHIPLIAWRHGQIPALLRAFGASPEQLLPGGVWPDAVYDNVILLTFDASGKLASQRLIHESLQVPARGR